MPEETPRIGGVVLCGGQSQRMGLPKATLPFGPELMIERVLRLLGQVVNPLVVVAAPEQPLPSSLQTGQTDSAVIVTRDEREGRGPLEGMFAGLSAIEPFADAAYITSCDVPLLVPAFVQRMIELLGEDQIAVPREDRFHHPLAAVYRTNVLPTIRGLLQEDRMRPAFLFDEVRTHRIPVDQLKEVDPKLDTLANLNHPSDYFRALQRAKLSPTKEIVDQLTLDP